MKHLTHLLNAFGKEDWSLTDGEIDLHVKGPSKATIGSELAELAEVTIEHDRVLRDTERLIECEASLERYEQVLTDAIEGTGLTRREAEIMAIGVESMKHELETDLGLTESLEAYKFDGPVSSFLVTNHSLESFKETVKKLWERIKVFLMRLGQLVQDMAIQITAANTKLKRRAEEIQRRAVTITGQANLNDIVISNPGRLWANGEFVGLKTELMAGVVTYATKLFPTQVKRYISDVTDTVNRLDPTGDEAAFEKDLQKVVDVKTVYMQFPGKEITPAQCPLKFGDQVQIQRSDALPGDKAIYAIQPGMINVNHALDVDQGLRGLRQKNLQMVLLSIPDSKPPASEYAFSPYTPAQCRLTASNIAKICDVMMGIGPAYRNNREALNNLIKAGDGFRQRLENSELTSATNKQRGEALLGALAGLQGLLGSEVRGILSDATYTLNRQLALVELCLDAHENAGK